MRRGLAWLGLAVALGGCAAEAPTGRAGQPGRIPAPASLPDPPAAVLPKDPVPVIAEMPEAAPASPFAPELTWEPGTLPPGWYIPDPPAAPEDPVAPPDPAQRMANLLRQNAWLARFWSELTPAEQLRVTRALARRGAEPAAAPATWDPMGLQDRVDLLFGRRGV
jgi:hypothetical protein